MNKRRFVGIVVGIVTLIVVGLGIYAYAIPYLTRSTASESLNDITRTQPVDVSQPQSEQQAVPQPMVERSGQFRGAPGKQVTGGVSLVKFDGTYFLRLEESFRTTPAPDLFVGFGNGDKVDTGTLFAKLKADAGGQNYELPADLDVSQYSQVFIYCKIFVQTYGIADLRDQTE